MPLSANEEIAALRTSVARLRGIAESLDAAQLRTQAYPSEWRIADVLSHLGSAAEIMRLRLEETLGEESLPEDFAQPIWDTWNAKSPEDQSADALVADRDMLEFVESVNDEQRSRIQLAFGPMHLDFAGAVAARLNEHALHVWDIEVALDPTATLAPESVEVIIDNLELITKFAGKPIGSENDLHVHTSAPVRDFTLALRKDSVALEPCADAHPADVTLPAEAFIRLVYGRLDPDHTPAELAGADLSGLRRAFPGL
jgi:uncharacterized protein (TIGR03083 family)